MAFEYNLDEFPLSAKVPLAFPCTCLIWILWKYSFTFWVFDYLSLAIFWIALHFCMVISVELPTPTVVKIVQTSQDWKGQSNIRTTSRIYLEILVQVQVENVFAFSSKSSKKNFQNYQVWNWSPNMQKHTYSLRVFRFWTSHFVDLT